jgi:glycosyltransferase involved in cell wall biosynthesis
VGTAVGGIPEIGVDDEPGLLVPARARVDAVAGALARMLGDGPLRRRMGTADSVGRGGRWIAADGDRRLERCATSPSAVPMPGRDIAATVRVAVYSDFPYRRDEHGLSCGESFVLFACRLATSVERLVLVGRLDPEAGRAAYALPPGVGFAPLPHYATLARPLAALGAAARSLRRFDRVLRDVDAVFLLGPHPLAFGFAVLARARGRRVVLGVRQDLPRYVRHRRPRRPDLVLAALVLDLAWRALSLRLPVAVVGDELARRYRRGRRVASIAITLVEPADIVPLSDAVARCWEGTRRLLSVGRLDREKNPLLLPNVLANLDPSWQLVVCGDGPLYAALAERLHASGLDGRARLLGYVPYGDGLKALYRSSHALVHVSHTEGVPQVLFEAFAAGLPVVGTAVGGVASAAGDAALLVAPDDARAVADAVRRLEDPVLRERLVAAGHRRALERTAEREQERLLSLLGDGDACA